MHIDEDALSRIERMPKLGMGRRQSRIACERPPIPERLTVIAATTPMTSGHSSNVFKQAA